MAGWVGWAGVYSERENSKRRKRGAKFVYELRDVPDGNLELKPVASSTNVVENAMSSGEKIPQQQIYAQLPEKDLKQTDLESEQIPKQDVQETDLESWGAKTDLESRGATIECAKEINDHLPRPDKSVSIGGSLVKEIIGHEWKIGQLHFKVQWSDGTTTIESLKDMREDYPRMSAQYVDVYRALIFEACDINWYVYMQCETCTICGDGYRC